MRDHLKNRDFHRQMHSLLAPRFLELGWKSQGGNKCSFIRGRKIFWLQVSQYSNSLKGARFTINMTEGSGPGGDTRVLYWLNETDRAVGRGLEEHIIARLPRPDPDPEVDVLGDNGGTIRVKLGDLVQPNSKQWDASGDVWLPYFTKDDLEDWAAFLSPRLDRLIASSSPGPTDLSSWAQRFRHLAGLLRLK
ncbi:hypothetical protein [Rhizobium sp. LEGMi135b]